MSKAQANSQQVQPYLFFDGRCEEALESCKGALDAKVEMKMRFKDNPDPQPGMTMPLSKTFLSPRFGMVTDSFGVGWMVIVQPRVQP